MLYLTYGEMKAYYYAGLCITDHSASPSQSLIDIHLHITEPFQPTNLTFPKKIFGKQNRSFHAKRSRRGGGGGGGGWGVGGGGWRDSPIWAI